MIKTPKNGSAHGTPVVQTRINADEELLLDIQANCLKALQDALREIAISLNVAPSAVANHQVSYNHYPNKMQINFPSQGPD
jgi:hypothetical protein